MKGGGRCRVLHQGRAPRAGLASQPASQPPPPPIPLRPQRERIKAVSAAEAQQQARLEDLDALALLRGEPVLVWRAAVDLVRRHTSAGCAYVAQVLDPSDPEWAPPGEGEGEGEAGGGGEETDDDEAAGGPPGCWLLAAGCWLLAAGCPPGAVGTMLLWYCSRQAAAGGSSAIHGLQPVSAQKWTRLLQAGLGRARGQRLAAPALRATLRRTHNPPTPCCAQPRARAGRRARQRQRRQRRRAAAARRAARPGWRCRTGPTTRARCWPTWRPAGARSGSWAGSCAGSPLQHHLAGPSLSPPAALAWPCHAGRAAPEQRRPVRAQEAAPAGR
jgi:hypothetical protein